MRLGMGRPPQNNGKMTTFRQKYTIVASEMDITYRVTPQAILLYFQDTFARFLTSRHLAAFDIIKQQLIWVITEFDVHFTGERPLWADDIMVEVEFTEVSPVRIYVDFRLLDREEKLFVQGTSCWVIVNSETKRPFGAKDLLAAAGIVGSGKEKRKATKENAAEKVLYQVHEHRVNVTDLDFNGHMCNRSYVGIAQSTAPVDFISHASLQRMHVKFLREAFFDDLLSCRIYKAAGQQGLYWHQFLNASEKEVCTIFTEWDMKPGDAPDVAELIFRQ